MAKAILVMDMPETCRNCKLWERKYFPTSGERGTDYCHAGVLQELDVDVYEGKPADCRLVPAIGYVEPVGNMVSWEDEE